MAINAYLALFFMVNFAVYKSCFSHPKQTPGTQAETERNNHISNLRQPNTDLNEVTSSNSEITMQKMIEMEARLVDLEEKYSDLITKNKNLEQQLMEQYEQNTELRMLASTLRRIVQMNLPQSRGKPDSHEEISVGIRNDDGWSMWPIGDRDLVESSSIVENSIPERTLFSQNAENDSHENFANDALRGVREYLGNREALLQEYDPKSEKQLREFSSDEFSRIPDDNSLVGRVITSLDKRNQELSSKYESLKNSWLEQMQRGGEEEYVEASDNAPTNSSSINLDERGKRLGISSKSAFGVAATISQLGSSKPQIVSFDHVFTNKGNDFLLSNSTFVCQVPGYYFFTFSLRSYDNRYLGVNLMKNNQYQVAVFTDSSERNVMESQSVVLELAAGDAVWLRLSPNAKFGIYSDQYHFTTFSGFLLYRTDKNSTEQ